MEEVKGFKGNFYNACINAAKTLIAFIKSSKVLVYNIGDLSLQFEINFKDCSFCAFYENLLILKNTTILEIYKISPCEKIFRQKIGKTDGYNMVLKNTRLICGDYLNNNYIIDLKTLGAGFYLGLSLFIISFLLAVFFWKRAAVSGKIFQAILIGVSIIFTISMTDSYDSYSEVYDRYTSGNYEVIEGEIEDYAPLNTKEGRKYDSFLVRDIEFSVPCLYGYSLTREQGSILKNGVYVRICYIKYHTFENEIVKIEVCKE